MRAFGAEAVVVSLGLDILGGDLEASGMSAWMWLLKSRLFCNTTVQAAVLNFYISRTGMRGLTERSHWSDTRAAALVLECVQALAVLKRLRISNCDSSMREKDWRCRKRAVERRARAISLERLARGIGSPFCACIHSALRGSVE